MNIPIKLREEIERHMLLSNYNPKELTSEQSTLCSKKTEKKLNESFIISEQTTQQKQTQKVKLTPEQINTAKTKIQTQAKKTAESIYQELKKAMDMDGDNVFTDYDGTNEGGVLTAIKKIKNKEVLDYLNQRIKQTKQFGNLKSWINAEMSDFDSEYGQVWKKLESMGYDGANYNMLLKFAGNTGVGTIIKNVDKTIDYLKSLDIGQIMEGFRSFLSGITGGVVQALLTVFGGPLGAGINIFAWSLVTIWDIYNASKGKPNWWNILIDIFSLITNGIAAKTMGAAKVGAAEAASIESTLSTVATKNSSVFNYIKSFGSKIMGFTESMTKNIQNALKWLIDKLSFLEPLLAPIKNAMGSLGNYVSKISQSLLKKSPIAVQGVVQSVKNVGPKILTFIETKVGKEVLDAFDEKVVQEFKNWVSDYAKEKSSEEVKKTVCSKNKTYCDIYSTIESSYFGIKEFK